MSAGRQLIVVLVAVASLGASVYVKAQNPGAPPPTATPKASAPIDLTGYWVAFVTEDWRYRLSLIHI